MTVVNLFGGPGCGKSTAATGLFSLMKTRGMSVEYTSEFAKELTWEERFTALSDQMYVVSRQHHKLFMLRDKVEMVVTDSPLLLSIHYGRHNFKDLAAFTTVVRELFDGYSNFNVVLDRVKPYNQKGRKETYQHAVEIDNAVKSMLDTLDYPYTTVKGDRDAPSRILRAMEDVGVTGVI